MIQIQIARGAIENLHFRLRLFEYELFYRHLAWCGDFREFGILVLALFFSLALLG